MAGPASYAAGLCISKKFISYNFFIFYVRYAETMELLNPLRILSMCDEISSERKRLGGSSLVPRCSPPVSDRVLPDKTKPLTLS